MIQNDPWELGFSAAHQSPDTPTREVPPVVAKDLPSEDQTALLYSGHCQMDNAQNPEGVKIGLWIGDFPFSVKIAQGVWAGKEFKAPVSDSQGVGKPWVP